MITCKDCKYWNIAMGESVRITTAKRAGLGYCVCEHFRFGYNYDPHEFLSNDVWVENDEGWGFYTGPDFGCIHGIID